VPSKEKSNDKSEVHPADNLPEKNQPKGGRQSMQEGIENKMN